MNAWRILVVEDDDALREAMHLQFTRDGYQTTSADDVAQALSILEDGPQDLIIADLNLPGSSGIDLLKTVRVDYPHTVVIIITAFGTVETAVEAMKSGAYDFIVKPVHPAELKTLVMRALEHSQLKEEIQILRSSFDRKYGFEQIIGSSESLLRALDVAGRAAVTDATVLIRGETGTGKEMVAKAIHLRSGRRERPFVTVNCAAIPKELLESELFGHLKGSFTGAFSHKKGKIEMAEGGTVMLDEIGDMPLELQVRILRLIQEREIEKVGATAPITVKVRIIAATHRDLDNMVKQGSFREDLYYRLMVIPVDLPPLRERFGDIPELVQYFFQQYRVKHGRPELKMPQNLMPYFLQYGWPGNVRELENAVARMIILSDGHKLSLEDVPDFLRSQKPPLPVEPAASPMGLADVERQLVLDALQKFNGNQTRAAQYLKISRRTFSYRLQRYGVVPETVKAMKRSA
jgi:two-component system NtrC family response regulator